MIIEFVVKKKKGTLKNSFDLDDFGGGDNSVSVFIEDLLPRLIAAASPIEVKGVLLEALQFDTVTGEKTSEMVEAQKAIEKFLLKVEKLQGMTDIRSITVETVDAGYYWEKTSIACDYEHSRGGFYNYSDGSEELHLCRADGYSRFFEDEDIADAFPDYFGDALAEPGEGWIDVLKVEEWPE